MRAKLTAVAAALALAAGCSAAFAQQPQQAGWYGGLALGQSKAKFDEASLTVANATESTVSKNDTDTAWKIFAGYRINNYFALEGGWTDFGKFSATREVTAPAAGSLSATGKVSGLHVEGVGIVPLGDFSLFGKLGTMYSMTNTSFSSTGAVSLTGDSNPKKSEFNLKWGLGAGYEITKNFGVRVEYEQVQKVGDSNTGEADVRMISVGGVYKF